MTSLNWWHSAALHQKWSTPSFPDQNMSPRDVRTGFQVSWSVWTHPVSSRCTCAPLTGGHSQNIYHRKCPFEPLSAAGGLSYAKEPLHMSSTSSRRRVWELCCQRGLADMVIIPTLENPAHGQKRNNCKGWNGRKEYIFHTPFSFWVWSE